MYTQRATLTALGLLALTACGTQSGDGVRTSEKDLPLTGVTWAVDGMTVDGKGSEPANRDPHITFDGKGGASGSFGCNGFDVEVKVAGDVVTMKPAVSTEIACEPKVQAFEDRMREALTGKLTAEVKGDRLTLTGPDGVELTFSERAGSPSGTPTAPEQPADPSKPGAPTGTTTPADPTAPVAPGEPDPNATDGTTLLGTAWKVTSLAPGPEVKGLPKGVDAPRLTFTEDRVGGNLGCNSGSATVRTANPAATTGTLVFGPVTSTRKLCDKERMTVEQALMEALSGTADYRVENGVLTVTGRDGTGFVAGAS